MEKSLYFEVEYFSLNRIIEKLDFLQVEYQIEQSQEITLFVFPDLPVRIYGAVREIFGRDCLPYPILK
ncbi:hypothetical protein ABE430_25140 [Brevibacillus agri]|uniref:hypothetical protein n=1 Tax=Brevibacillus TaxID=55080 RepID=UPI002E1FF883|nr:hypothetical protein [Brevibacillus borstelensis]